MQGRLPDPFDFKGLLRSAREFPRVEGSCRKTVEKSPKNGPKSPGKSTAATVFDGIKALLSRRTCKQNNHLAPWAPRNPGPSPHILARTRAYQEPPPSVQR